jgi:hypothetical protein
MQQADGINQPICRIYCVFEHGICGEAAYVTHGADGIGPHNAINIGQVNATSQWHQSIKLPHILHSVTWSLYGVKLGSLSNWPKTTVGTIAQ